MMSAWSRMERAWDCIWREDLSSWLALMVKLAKWVSWSITQRTFRGNLLRMERVRSRAMMSYSITDINVTLSVAVRDAKFWCGKGYEQSIGGESSRGWHEASQRLRIQSGSSLDFHLRLAHLSYDIIERLAGDPKSENCLTNDERPMFVTCAHGKQRRNTQP